MTWQNTLECFKEMFPLLKETNRNRYPSHMPDLQRMLGNMGAILLTGERQAWEIYKSDLQGMAEFENRKNLDT